MLRLFLRPVVQGKAVFRYAKVYYSQAQKLPALPVPPLAQTIEKYLKSVQPLVTLDDFKTTEKLAQEFLKPGGEGEKLQSKLLDRAKSKENWLADWWLTHTYLTYRESLTINANPGFTLPTQTFQSTDAYLIYTANLLTGLIDYKTMVDSESIPVQMMGKAPLCMSQFYNVLSTTRIPGIKKDSLVHFPSNIPDKPKHVMVMHNNHIFAMDVYGSNGHPLSTEQLKDQLKQVIDMSQDVAPPIGIMTTENRNSWGKTYAKLLKDKSNAASLDLINRGIFTLCLDQPVDHVALSGDKLSGIASQMLHGGGTRNNSGNRWFDKSLQMIVGPDGSVGGCYEHSPAEGPPVIASVDHALDLMNKGGKDIPAAPGVLKPKKIKFNFSKDVLEDIETAKDHIDAMVRDLDMAGRIFPGFGKKFAKTYKLSPDAFIQVAMQLAYYRYYNRPTATYESASLRQYTYGRTETIRSCTPEATDFVKTMDSNAPRDQKTDLLRKAIKAHSAYTIDCMNMKGVDRHFLGLKLAAIENGLNIPALLLDSSFSASTHFRLSTSQVPSAHDVCMTFGPMYPDGYGFCYNPQSSKVVYCVSAFNSSPETNAAKLADLFESSLVDMQAVITGSKL